MYCLFCPLYYTRPSINSHMPRLFFKVFSHFLQSILLSTERRCFCWPWSVDAFRDFNPPRRSRVSSTCGTLSKKKVRPDDHAGRRSFGQGQTQATWEPSRWFYEESSTNPKSNRIAYLYSLGGGGDVYIQSNRLYSQLCWATAIIRPPNGTRISPYTHIIGLLPIDVVRL